MTCVASTAPPRQRKLGLFRRRRCRRSRQRRSFRYSPPPCQPSCASVLPCLLQSEASSGSVADGAACSTATSYVTAPSVLTPVAESPDGQDENAAPASVAKPAARWRRKPAAERAEAERRQHMAEMRAYFQEVRQVCCPESPHRRWEHLAAAVNHPSSLLPSSLDSNCRWTHMSWRWKPRQLPGRRLQQRRAQARRHVRLGSRALRKRWRLQPPRPALRCASAPCRWASRVGAPPWHPGLRTQCWHQPPRRSHRRSSWQCRVTPPRGGERC